MSVVDFGQQESGVPLGIQNERVPVGATETETTQKPMVWYKKLHEGI